MEFANRPLNAEAPALRAPWTLPGPLLACDVTVVCGRLREARSGFLAGAGPGVVPRSGIAATGCQQAL